MKNFFSKLLSSSVEISTTRLAFIFWTIGTFFMWVFVSIKNQTLEAVPDSIVAMISALTAAKAMQSFAEIKRYVFESEKINASNKSALEKVQNAIEITTSLNTLKNVVKESSQEQSQTLG